MKSEIVATTQTWSLRHRLVVLVCLLSLITSLLGSFWVYRTAVAESEQLFDAALIESGHALLAIVAHEIRELSDPEDSASALDAIDHDHVERLYFQIRGAHGQLLFRSPQSPPTRLGGHDVGLHLSIVDGVTYRVYTLHSTRHRLWVDVAQPMAVREQLTRASALRLVVPGTLLLLLLAPAVLVAVRRVTRPVIRYSEALDALPLEALHSVSPHGLPSELMPVATAVSGLVDRVQRALLLERTLTADAAHELRTPLAALRAQAQVALRARDEQERAEALTALIAGVDRSTRLVDGVLALARLDAQTTGPSVVQRDALPMQSLEAVLHAVLADLESARRGGSVQRHVHARPVKDRVDIDMIGVLMRNMIDNGLRHAKHALWIELDSDESGVVFEVRDDGDGMSPEAMARAGDRFFRADSSQSGSGLGLAMVKRIVDVLGGRLEFVRPSSGPGFSVRVSWPLSELAGRVR